MAEFSDESTFLVQNYFPARDSVAVLSMRYKLFMIMYSTLNAYMRKSISTVD